LESADLTDYHIYEFMQVREGEVWFPNLENMNLKENNIRSEGLEMLLKTGLFSLKTLLI